MMPKALRDIFTKIDESNYGPKAKNPVWGATDAKGLHWRIERHQWVLPYHHWGWVAEPVGHVAKPIYGDNLEEIADKLGRIP